MIKKILILLAILLPFITYYVSFYIIKKTDNKKFPMLLLSSISIVLLALVLIFFRFSDNDPSDGKYFPPKFKDGKVISPKTR